MVVQATGDINAAGPDDGPACSVAKQYSDEAPTGLRPDVKAAWISIKKLAARKGVTLCLNDGKRSKAQQIALYNLYVKDYGTTTANDLVLPWQKSAHVKGYAVDVQPANADQWLQATKGSLGFCRIYDNETWQFRVLDVLQSQRVPPSATQAITDHTHETPRTSHSRNAPEVSWRPKMAPDEIPSGATSVCLTARR